MTKRTLRIKNELIDRAQETLIAAINNPHTNPDQKAEFQKKLAKLQKQRIDITFDLVDRQIETEAT